jgi:PAS domain S-box-containing protein
MADAAPANPLHRRLDSIASQPVVQVGLDARLADVARLMAARRVSCVPVVDADGRAHGMVSELRLLAVLRGDLSTDTPARDATEPLLTVDGSLPCDQAWQLCLQRGVSHLGVVDAQQRLVGLVSETDFRMLIHLSVLAGHHLVPSVMQPVARVVPVDQTLQDAAHAMGLGTEASVVVVDAAGRPVGVLTARDAARCLAMDAAAGSLPLAQVMSQPVLGISTRATLNEAADRLLALKVRHLVVLDDDGALVGMVSGHDLARAMAVGLMDAAMADDRARHRAILDALPDLVWLKDPDGVYLTCNPRFEQLYAAPEAQIIGKTDHDFVDAELAAFFRANDLRAMARNAPTTNEELLRFASDGHTELVHTIKTPVRDAQGRLLGVLGIGRDITALRQVETEYRQLFAHNPAPMAVYARHNQRLVAVNDAFCALYGCTTDEALQFEVADLLMPEHKALARASIPQMQGLLSAEWHHQRRDGTPMQVLVQSHELVRDGVDCRVVVITDITRLHRTQQRDQSRLRLLDSLVRGDPLADLLRQLALDHEAAFPGSLCSVLLLDDTGTCLEHGAAPSLPDFYNQAIHGMAIGPGMGACGTACHSGQRVVTEDIATDPRWVEFRALAAEAGLAACWSTPVLGPGGRPLGTFAVYRRQPGVPGDEELDHASFASGLAALAVGQHRSAQRLRDGERRLADTLQAVPDPIWLKDPQGQLLLANAAYRRLAAPDGAETAAMSPATATERNQAALAADDLAVARSGAPATAERWLSVPPDHRQALFEVVTTPMRGAQGQPAGVLGIARDITLIKQGAQALADQSRLVDTMFSQTTDAILLLDPETQLFVTFNDAACNGLGYSRDEFARLRPIDLQAVQNADDVRKNMGRAMAGERLTFDNTHRRRDGSPQHVQITLRRVDFSGRPLLSVVWQDVTESRLHADRIRRLNQAYAVLSGVNEAIVRLQDVAALQAEVCRIAVDVGGFGQAWIGRAQASADPLLIEARAGSADSTPLAWGQPARQALQDDAPVVLDDPTAGGRSVAAFPISPAGSARSVLVLQAEGAGHFDPDQLALYARLVRDVAHAIESIAAETARRQEQRLREQLMESVAGLFYVLDAQGRLQMWNRHLESLTGYAADALRGRHLTEFFAPEHRAAAQSALAQVMAQQEMQAETPLVVQGGRQVPHLLVARRVDLDTGPVVVGTGIDITDRLRAERELSQHREHLEHLVAQRTAELEQLNRRLAHEDLRLRTMLSLSQRAAGLDEAVLWRHGIDALVALVGSPGGCLAPVQPDGRLGVFTWSGCDTAGTPPDGLDAVGLAAVRAACEQALHGRQLVRSQMMLEGRPHVLLAVPVLDQDRCVLVVSVVRAAAVGPGPVTAETSADCAAQDLDLAGADLWDIVQRRRTEIALAQAKAAADAASQAKSAFLANMSHEIRTPLNAVLGFSHLLRREPLSARQLDHLGKIADASQHLLQVINDILDFSKIEARKVELDPTDFALQPCLQRMESMVADRAAANQVQLQLRIDPACPQHVRGDRMRLEQVLLNLLSNAVKFTPGGRVQLLARLLAPGWLRFDVEDTGIGIGQAQLPQLFRPFEQADASTTRRFGGTGLGLAICHRLVLLMGGRIGVSSRLGEGSRFWVELPLPAAGAPVLAPAPAQPAAPTMLPPDAVLPLHGLQVLLAEDNPINQEVALDLLCAQGAQVTLADDGEAAVQCAREGRFDLVLMDVQMPRLDGLRAAAAIRQLPGWQTVPIIAMTASAFAEDRADCLAAGMDDVLVKPVEPEALTRSLLHWCGAGRPLPAAPVRAAAAVHGGLRDSLLALRRLLQSHDTEAADHLARHAPLLQAALGAGPLSALSAEVQGYAFEAALARVDQLLAGRPD